jgi:hypothetical protein
MGKWTGQKLFKGRNPNCQNTQHPWP